MKLIPTFIFAGYLMIPVLSWAETAELKADDFIALCAGKEPRYEAVKKMPKEREAFCAGYVEASTKFFHSGEIKDFMPKGACYNIGDAYLETPVKEAVVKYMAITKKTYTYSQDPLQVIADAVVAAYPCDTKVKPAVGEDDFRVFGTGNLVH